MAFKIPGPFCIRWRDTELWVRTLAYTRRGILCEGFEGPQRCGCYYEVSGLRLDGTHYFLRTWNVEEQEYGVEIGDPYHLSSREADSIDTIPYSWLLTFVDLAQR